MKGKFPHWRSRRLPFSSNSKLWGRRGCFSGGFARCHCCSSHSSLPKYKPRANSVTSAGYLRGLTGTCTACLPLKSTWQTCQLRMSPSVFSGWLKHEQVVGATTLRLWVPEPWGSSWHPCCKLQISRCQTRCGWQACLPIARNSTPPIASGKRFGRNGFRTLHFESWTKWMMFWRTRSRLSNATKLG
jgi:hypothetical protein